MPFDIEVQKAIENSSADTVAYIAACKNMPGHQILNTPDSINFRDAFRLFTRLSLLVTRRRPEIAVQCILHHVMPALADTLVVDITRIKINRIVNAAVLDGKIVMARRIFSLLKQFLSWCEFQGYVSISPLASQSLNKVAGGMRSKPRERVLSEEEIIAFWNIWELSNASPAAAWAARLILCSARRPDEVLRAKVSEFNLVNGVWNQGTRNKSARPLSLPISPIMQECIENLLTIGQGSEWLVPSPKNPDRPVSKVFVAQALRRLLQLSYCGIEESFEVRDLRRTARSLLSKLGVSQDVSRKIMNHSLEGLDRVYNHHDYFDEMASGLNCLSAYLKGLVNQ